MKTTPLRAIASTLYLLVCIQMAGCASSAPVTGRVIPGDISFIGMVDPGDERLKSAGIPAVELVSTPDPGRTAAAAILAKTTSDAKGDFKLKFSDPSIFSRPAAFAARKDGYVSASTVMPVPTEDRRLLVILKPTAAVPPAATQRDR
jgi:hypothetical protein